MKRHILILMITILTSNSLNPMHKATHRKLKENKKSSYNNLITKEFLFAKTIRNNNILSTTIICIILNYSRLLRDKDFRDSTAAYAEQWRDFRIPTLYHHILSSKQMNLIQNLLTSEHFEGYSPIDFSKELIQIYRPYEMHYCLKSKKDYKLFLTLPIELRQCLTQLPSSKTDYNIIIPENINPNKTILVKSIMAKITKETDFTGYKAKLIVPEEKEKH